MASKIAMKYVCGICMAMATFLHSSSVLGSVSYDNRTILVNGERRILISGSIHYPRSSPEMWPDLIQKAKNGGIDVIQTYVFWNVHEPSPGKYSFDGRYDLVRFIKLVKESGLYVHLRIGPYVCAEWNFGGFPVWLKYIPGIEFRTDNEPFKAQMYGFTKKIVDMMKSEKLFEPQGGPIILAQIENEYGPVEYYDGARGKAYTQWAANMAIDLGADVPWIMCKQDDAPDPVINSCNGFYCHDFVPNNVDKPKIWTEAWTGWFTSFGNPIPSRPAEDLAFSVANFIQKGGSFINYYMYHGGTNFGRTAGGPFIATSYDYDAPLDEYGLTNQPKWGHLKDLHRAIKLCEPALVSGDAYILTLGNKQEARVWNTSGGGACAAFLANYDTEYFRKVSFAGMSYDLPPWSISVLPDCRKTAYNTARVGAQSTKMKMTPVVENMRWESFDEGTASHVDRSFTVTGLLEQINVTRDVSDYLWYTTDVRIDPSEAFLNDDGVMQATLTVMSAGHALHVFVNGQLSGSVYGSIGNPKITFREGVWLTAGDNRISVLSIAVGLPNVGEHFETWNAGVLGPVTLNGLSEGKRDLTWGRWTYKVGLEGEVMNLHSLDGSSSVEWMEGSLVTRQRPLTWYKTSFECPDGDEPLALDMGAMGKGQAWINGVSIGRHWPGYIASGDCGNCSYAGWYGESSCLQFCGRPSQRWYHVPRGWLYPTGNLLVVFEEWGGNPDWVSLVRREVGAVCADIFERQPSLASWRTMKAGDDRLPPPLAHLRCGRGKRITAINFASFGTPHGSCGQYSLSTCHAPMSYKPFEQECMGRNSCYVRVHADVFGGDPCPNFLKKLSVEAVCG